MKMVKQFQFLEIFVMKIKYVRLDVFLKLPCPATVAKAPTIFAQFIIILQKFAWTKLMSQ